MQGAQLGVALDQGVTTEGGKRLESWKGGSRVSAGGEVDLCNRGLVSSHCFQ